VKSLLVVCLAAAGLAALVLWGDRGDRAGARPDPERAGPARGDARSAGTEARAKAAPGERSARSVDVLVDARPGIGFDGAVEPAGRAVVLRTEDGAGPVAGRGRFDGAGRAVVSVPEGALEISGDGRTSLVAIVEGDGVCSSAERVALAREGAEEHWRAILRLRPGRLLRLRLARAGGAPVDAPLERLRVRYAVDDATWLGLHPNRKGLRLSASRAPLSLRREGAGAYLLSVPDGVEPGALSLEVDGVGAALLDLDVHVLRADAVVERDVVLEATGAVRGRGVDGRGAPVEDLAVHVVSSEAGRPAAGSLRGGADPEPAERARIGGPAGRLFARARTDDDGRFAADGLALREFLVLVPGVTVEAERGPFGEIARIEAALAPEEHVLRFDRAILECEVRGAEGRSVQVEVFDAGPVERTPRVVLRGYGRRAPVQAPIRTHRGVPREGARFARFEVPHGRHYVVAASAGEARGEPRVLSAAAPDDVVRARLDVASFRALASLHVELLVNHDIASSDMGRIGVWVEDPRTGRPHDEAEYRSGWFDPDSHVHLRAPEGRVRVVAEGLLEIALPHGTVAGARRLGRAEAVVDLVAGEVNEVELRLPRAAHLEVEVRGAPSQADVALEAARVAAGEGGDAFEGEGASTGAQITLTDTATGRAFPLVRVGRATEGAGPAGRYAVEHWPLGETHTSIGLPSGVFELNATQATRAPIVRSVTLVPGETTSVALDLGG